MKINYVENMNVKLFSFHRHDYKEEVKDIDGENIYENVTGFKSPEHFQAYELGKEHKEKLLIRAIEKWDGKSTTSCLYQLLSKKFKEIKE